MDSQEKNQLPNKNNHLSDHMANENTFLAWVRTSLAIMAFGFVIERFSLFLKQFALFFQKLTGIVPTTAEPTQSYSAVFGITMIALGSLICLFSFIDYKKISKQIENNAYQPSSRLFFMLILLILLIGIFLTFALIHAV